MEERKRRILNKCQWKCFWCGNDLDLNSFTADHFIPRSKGGSGVSYNIVAACRSCNSKRGNTLPNRKAWDRLARRVRKPVRELKRLAAGRSVEYSGDERLICSKCNFRETPDNPAIALHKDKESKTWIAVCNSCLGLNK